MTNFIGQTLFVAEALPTANTAAAFAALTWVRVKGELDLFQLGITHSLIEKPALSGFTGVDKGAGTGSESTATFEEVPADAGQEDIKNAADGDSGILSVKIVDGSGTDNAPVSGDPVIYAQGIAHSHVPNQPTNANFQGFSISFRQNAKTIVATEPAA